MTLETGATAIDGLPDSLEELQRRAAADALSRLELARAAIELAVQRESLYEAKRSAVDAAETARRAFAVVTEMEASIAASRGVLSERRSARQTIADLNALCVETASLELPASDATIRAADILLFERTLTACKLIERALHGLTQTHAERQARRSLGLLALAVSAVCIFYSVWSWLHMLHGVATASAVFGDDRRFAADNVLDENAGTEWQLPDGTSGWIEIVLTRTRDVTAVRLRNGHNRHYNDRATRAYRVELIGGRNVIATVAGAFAEFTSTPDWVTVPVRATNVDRVRVEVLSHFGLGGGLADVDLQ